jgi:hypothetical protein
MPTARPEWNLLGAVRWVSDSPHGQGLPRDDTHHDDEMTMMAAEIQRRDPSSYNRLVKLVHLILVAHFGVCHHDFFGLKGITERLKSLGSQALSSVLCASSNQAQTFSGSALRPE